MRDRRPPDFDPNEITYNASRERYHLAVDPEQTTKPSLILVHFIAHIAEKPPRSLPPLQSAIDTDSLDRWLSTTSNPQSDAELTFTYTGYQITLDTIGTLWAQPTHDTEEDSDEPHID